MRRYGGRVVKRAEGGPVEDDIDPVMKLMLGESLNRLKEAFIAADKAGDTGFAQLLHDTIVKKERLAEFDPLDVTKGIGSGIVQGARTIAGLPRQIQDNVQPGKDAATQRLYSLYTPEQRALAEAWKPSHTADAPKFPTGREIAGVIPGANDAADFKPETGGGNIGKAGGDLVAGGMILGRANTIKGAVEGGIKLGAIPGAIGEAATSLTVDELDPYVRFAGNVLGASGASILTNWAKGIVARPSQAFNDLKFASDAFMRVAQKSKDPAKLAEAERLAQKTKLLVDIAYTARTKSAFSRKSELDEMRQGFADLDLRLQHANPGDTLFDLFDQHERSIFTRIGQGAPVERMFRELAEASGDIRTLLEIGVGGGMIDAIIRGYSQGPGADFKQSALTGAGLFGMAAVGKSAAKSAANARTRVDFDTIVEAILKGKAAKVPVPGRLNIPTMGMYGTELGKTLPGPDPDEEARYMSPGEAAKGALRFIGPGVLSGKDLEEEDERRAPAILGIRG
jgi:hypothetical protein